MAVHIDWHKADISRDAEPEVTWRPVYSGIARPDIIQNFLESAEKGDVVRITARKV